MTTPSPLLAVHRMIEHLIRNAPDRALVRSDSEALFERFGVEPAQREVLRHGGRDELAAMGVHPNYVVKWLIWSGRSTIAMFSLNHYFDRR